MTSATIAEQSGLPPAPDFGSTEVCAKWTFSVGINERPHSRLRSSALGLRAISDASVPGCRALEVASAPSSMRSRCGLCRAPACGPRSRDLDLVR